MLKSFMTEDLESSMEQGSAGIFPGLRQLFRNRLVRVSGVLVLAATAWLHSQNHQPIYHTPAVAPVLQQRLRQILDSLDDEDQPPLFEPTPELEDVGSDEIVIG